MTKVRTQRTARLAITTAGWVWKQKQTMLIGTQRTTTKTIGTTRTKSKSKLKPKIGTHGTSTKSFRRMGTLSTWRCTSRNLTGANGSKRD